MRSKILALALAGPLSLFDIGSSLRGGAGGVSAGANTTFTGQNVFTGRTTFGSAQDAANAVDFNVTAGCLTFEGSGADANETQLCPQNPAADYTLTLPTGASTGIPGLAVVNNWSNNQTLTSGSWWIVSDGTAVGGVSASSANNAIRQNNGQTPDQLTLITGTTSNSWSIFEHPDNATDFGNGPCLTAACTVPHLIVHDSDTNQTDYSSISAGGTAGKIVKTLTEASATDIAKVTLAAEEGTGGMLLVSVYATDGATPQVRFLRIHFAATNDGGTTTCTLTTAEEIDHTPTGTLTATVTCVDGTAALLLQVNATSSLTQTTLEARSQLFVSGPGQIQPQ